MATPVVNLAEEVFTQNISDSRYATGRSIQDFRFKKGRLKLLSQYGELREDSKGIIYWMCRESRVQDNWSLLYAQKLSLKFKIPLFVCFFLDDFKDLYPTTRQVSFLRKGLDLVKKELEDLNISFYLLRNSPIELVEIIKQNDIGCLVCDFFPLKIVIDWQDRLKELLPNNVAFVQVDAHNIVPCWVASDKLEKSSMAIRRKILNFLPEYFTDFPMVCEQTEKKELKLNDNLLWSADDKLDIEFVEEITWTEPGEKAGIEMLRTFLLERLKFYGISSYDPSKKHQSNLSPWIHFGQISSQRIALEVMKLKRTWKEQCQRFLEEAILRKETCDNFCLYNPNYDNFNGADKWAQDTLNLHRKDKRDFIYSAKEFEQGFTHDPIWNSAQVQLVTEGKLQVYMRMYWCKKILEWTESPEKAIEIALWLNNKYSIDGSDPNSFVGVMWSICGVHDQGFKERSIFGKVRFMVDYSLSKKYDMETYCAWYPKSSKKYIDNLDKDKENTDDSTETKSSRKRVQKDEETSVVPPKIKKKNRKR